MALLVSLAYIAYTMSIVVPKPMLQSSPHRIPSNHPSSAIDLTDLNNSPKMNGHNLPVPSSPISRSNTGSPVGLQAYAHDSDSPEAGKGVGLGEMALLLRTIDFAAIVS